MDKVKNLQHSESIKKLTEMAKAIAVAMFFTKGTGRKEAVRPMGVSDIDEEGNLWFLSSKQSAKIDSIRQDDSVQLVFSHPGKEMYLELSGEASITEDREVIKRIWSPLAKAWFEGGVDDPDICAIKVVPDEGHYWDTQHGKVIEFLHIITAAVTGKKTGDGVSGQLAVH